MKHKFSFLILLIVLPKIIFALSEHDFAYIGEIQTQANTPFYELDIPSAVYETISRADLGDLRVLNGNGQVVPHGLRSMAMIRTNKTDVINPPFYPLYQQTGESVNDLHLSIKRNSQGEVINIHSYSPKQSKTKLLSGYLLDLRKWKKPVDEIKVVWKNPDGKSFIRKLNISQSSNLETWRLIALGKTLVNLSYQNHQLTNDTITLNHSKAKYIRIMFSDKKAGLELKSIQVSHTKQSTSQQRNWQAVSVSTTNRAGEYTFHHKLKTLARQLQIKLPENNTVVRVMVLSRINKDQPWIHRGSTLLYRLSVNGSDIEKSNINISASRDNQWLLRFDQQGGGIGSGLPKVKLEWQPQQLVFVARGEPPFRVVWGSAQIQPMLINANQLLPISIKNTSDNTNYKSSIVSTAELQIDTIRSINKKVLTPKPKEINWQQWMLWILLVSAAAILIWMAVRLMKKMDN